MGGYNLPPEDLICYLTFWEKERWGDKMISIGLRDVLWLLLYWFGLLVASMGDASTWKNSCTISGSF